MELRNVTLSYGGEPVVKELSLTLQAGALTVLVGPNGSGKSTLLLAMDRLLSPVSGEILLSGQPVSSLSPKAFARQTAYLPQNRPIPEITAERLVLHGRFPHGDYPRRYSAADRAMVQEAMERTDTTAFMGRYLSELSGGERQRVYIAMLLAQQTETILLDEPTTYLDAEHTFRVLEIAKALAREGKRVVLSLHDLPAAFQYADRIILLQKGQIMADGTPETVANHPALPDVMGVRLKAGTAAGETYWYMQPVRRDG